MKTCLNCKKELKKQLKYCSNKCQGDLQRKKKIDAWKSGSSVYITTIKII